MSIEQPQASDEEHLSSEEAQEEANMMRVRLREMVGHEPTVADYDKALDMIQVLKETAASETDRQRAFLKMMQVGNKYFTIGVDAFVRLITLGKNANEAWAEDRLHDFDDARARLEELKQKAETLE